MFPEGLTVTLDGRDSRDLIDSGDSVIPEAEGNSCWRSTGVGGVIVVTGAGTAVCGGVVGVGEDDGSRCFGAARSVRIGAGIGD